MTHRAQPTDYATDSHLEPGDPVFTPSLWATIRDEAWLAFRRTSLDGVVRLATWFLLLCAAVFVIAWLAAFGFAHGSAKGYQRAWGEAGARE